MKNGKVLWTLALALVLTPALAAAQEGAPGGQQEAGPAAQSGQADWRPGPGMGGGVGMGPGMGGCMGMGPGMGGGVGMGHGGMMRNKMWRPGMGGPGFMAMPPEKTLAEIKKYDPDFARKVETLRDSEPAKYMMVMQMAGRALFAARMDQNENMERDAVKDLSLDFQSRELSLQYSKASDAEKNAVKAKLRAVLSDLFDVKSRIQEQRVKRMQADIARLQKRLDVRKANKNKIVDLRLDQLTGEGFGW